MTLAIKDGAGVATAVKTTLDGTDHVSHIKIDTSALPSGASTSANQATTNASLSSIDTRLATAPPMATTGGLTPYNLISAATNNATSLKASAGSIGSIVATNNNVTNIAYLKLYNKATAPVVGTDVPVQVYALAAVGGGVAISFPTGLAFSLGIAFAITNGMLNTDSSVASGQVAVSIGYK